MLALRTPQLNIHIVNSNPINRAKHLWTQRMARQWGEQSSVSTSIALLQERFTQLQKMKEKREEKEHQMLIYSETWHANMNFQKDQTFLSRTAQQESSPVSIGLEFPNKHTNFQSMRNMRSPIIWSNNATSAEKTARSPSYNYDKWDVDTTLHL